MAKIKQFIEAILFSFVLGIAVLLWLSLGGCAQPQIKTEYITVPIAPPPEIKRPALAIEDLKTGDGPDVVIRAYSITIKALEGYALQLEAVLSAYKPKPGPTTSK